MIGCGAVWRVFRAKSKQKLYPMLAFLLPLVLAQALNEPAKIHMGAWLDTADTAPGANNGDRPVLFNQRMGFNASFFQYAQNIPIDTFPFPIEQVEATESDALIHLTVYPRPTPWEITDAQISILTAQMSELNKRGRRVIMRFAPGNVNLRKK